MQFFLTFGATAISAIRPVSVRQVISSCLVGLVPLVIGVFKLRRARQQPFWGLALIINQLLAADFRIVTDYVLINFGFLINKR